MSERNSIDITVYPTDDGEPVRVRDVQYLSLVNGETYGIPALITEERIKGEMPVRILYVNPENVAVIDTLRKA